MSKPKLKLLATPDKTRPEKPLVQLTEAQLEAISKRSAEGSAPQAVCIGTDTKRN